MTAERFHAAVHEAGHLIAAELFARLPFAVRVHAAGGGETHHYGPAPRPWPESIDPNADLREAFATAVICLAGAQACRSFGIHDWARGAERDRGQAWWTAILMVGDERADAFLAAAETRAGELVTEYYAAIERLAAELERRGDHLEGRELVAALAEALDQQLSTGA